MSPDPILTHAIASTLDVKTTIIFYPSNKKNINYYFGHKISINTIDNLRPISISNTQAQIFERLLLLKMDKINNTHINQFGYKNKTSCTHALFAFKETIIRHLDNKQYIFAAFLDAIKAFDNLWRQALFLKLKKSKNFFKQALSFY